MRRLPLPELLHCLWALQSRIFRRELLFHCRCAARRGVKRSKAFLYGVLSGVVEPIGGGLTILLASYITPLLPYLLAFAAGAMLYVVVEELIPESSQGEHSNVATIAFAIGFVLMMTLDVALG